ncbi:hypothetical protein ACHAWF_013934 [Thalassiosira exigua]
MTPPLDVCQHRCVTKDPTVRYGYCDVPVCGSPTASPTSSARPTSSAQPSSVPSVSSRPSVSVSPTQICPVADRSKCGCDAVSLADYRGSIDRTQEDLECARWDGKFGKYNPLNTLAAGLTENYCRNPDDDPKGPWCFARDGSLRYCDIPVCDPCSCMPPCGMPNNEECGCPSALQASACCDPSDSACRCDYLKEACRKGLNTNTDFCADMEVECCRGNDDPNCAGSIYEQFCYEFPSCDTCEYAGEKRCNYDLDIANGICLCYFYTYPSTIEDEEVKGACKKASSCSAGLAEDADSDQQEDKTTLDLMFNLNGGEYWFDRAGWLEEGVPHCQWFGISCDGLGNVVQVNLRNNNLTGSDLFDYFYLPELHTLDIANNHLSGRVGSQINLFLRKLEHIDISGNNFGGHLDMLFPPTTWYVDFSHNNFTSVGFKKYNGAYETLEIIDLRNNSIDQNASEIFVDAPTNLWELYVSDNMIRNSLPNPFPRLLQLEILRMDGNDINGTLPDISQGAPRLRELDLSRQGLNGSIPDSIAYLEDLRVLNLSENRLSETIPSVIGTLTHLHTLDLSSNRLSQQIPADLERLKDILEHLDLSNNHLSDLIPVEITNIEAASVRLSGNPDLSSPAPLMLCFMDNFDVLGDSRLCPQERNALKLIYDGAKGREWTTSTKWLHPYDSHCMWYGISCDDTNTHTAMVELNSNGMSGTLSPELAKLHNLEVLNLADNDIKGSIPTEIGLLSSLRYLRLCYNAFVGNETNFGNLEKLELIQLQGNRLSGTIPPLNFSPPLNREFSDFSSFVADCGNPSDFEESLTCEECTMCCNVQSDCYPQEETEVQDWGFNDYMHFSGIFIGGLVAACCCVFFIALLHQKWKHRNKSRAFIRQQSMEFDLRDKQTALETIGDDSVYQFLICTSFWGWIIVLLTMGAQIWMLLVFVDGAEIDLSRDSNDMVYYFRCPRDEAECRDTADLTEQGWATYGILMAAHLLEDLIHGIQLVLFSSNARHNVKRRMAFLLGGMLLICVTSFTLYTSTIYNAAIATSNTEIIMNSVVILFICDIDELTYDILTALSPRFVQWISPEGADDDESFSPPRKADDKDEEEMDEDEKRVEEAIPQDNMRLNDNQLSPVVRALNRTTFMGKYDNKNVGEQLQILMKDVAILHKTMDMVMEQNSDLKRHLSSVRRNEEVDSSSLSSSDTSPKIL